ncbi:MAG: LpqB family beta-propeller domain-containing protein [Planctomycetota bacterium]
MVALRSDDGGPGDLPSSVILRGVPFTTYPSSEVYPAFSPDGTKVAFAWTDPDHGSLDIYVKQIGREPPLRVTSDPAAEISPSWSPDGKFLAFVRIEEDHAGSTICRISSLGGEVQNLCAVATTVQNLDWSPDASWLAFATPEVTGLAAEIRRLDLESLEVTVVEMTGEGHASVNEPRVSPDGEWIAYVGADRAGLQDIFLLPSGGGPSRRLTSAQRLINGLDWMPDGREIIFASIPVTTPGLRRVMVADGTLSWLPNEGIPARHPSLAGTGNRLVYEAQAVDFNIWRIRQPGSGTPQLDTAPLVNSTRNDTQSTFSPDGEKIAFISNRSGTPEIWMSNADGSRERRLTSLNGVYIWQPSWSADGEEIVFSGLVDGHAQLHLLSVASGQARRLRNSGRHEIASAWSRDGHWIYFMADSPEGWRMWQVRPDGRDASQFPLDAQVLLHEARDGSSLTLLRADLAGIWKWDRAGSATCLVEGSVTAGWLAYVAAENGVYLVKSASATTREMYLLDYATQEARKIAVLPGFGCSNLALSPDGETLLYDRSEEFRCDLTLVNDFR